MRSTLTLLALVLVLAAAGCGGFHNEPLGSSVIKGRVVGAVPGVASVTLRIAHESGSIHEDDHEAYSGNRSGSDDDSGSDDSGSDDSGGDSDEDTFRTGVDADGRFELRDVPATPGELYIVASATHAAHLTVDPPGGEVLDVGDVVPQPGAFFVVTVLNTDGQPVPHAELDVDGTELEHVPVDAQGRARLGPLPEACYRVRATADDYREAREERCARAGEELAVTLVLEKD